MSEGFDFKGDGLSWRREGEQVSKCSVWWRKRKRTDERDCDCGEPTCRGSVIGRHAPALIGASGVTSTIIYTVSMSIDLVGRGVTRLASYVSVLYTKVTTR